MFWSRVLSACPFVSRSGSFNIIEFKWGAALMKIVRGDTIIIIDNAVSQINVCVGTLKFETKTILSPKWDIR